MTLEEYRRREHQLKTDVLELVTKFYDETGVLVTKLQLYDVGLKSVTDNNMVNIPSYHISMDTNL